ncbi:hypothetical protein M409DRAFT_65975 [Zasmidium cellare ATCC 36951]|uniref:DAGKc domain-containing protein n=1 Tax=Zasmidium cellare ATCC 36951 TaxID=1080233 RepID=A0A6A6CQ30_ZASCE|nr:uncharacterized protein M409DRAFT_65975 [Zasmidium cellare ATCC 36951]KAF2167932.1 hypothetical protein M409DRAFT_65975 [Zasmidium cellare ATCC 36951]
MGADVSSPAHSEGKIDGRPATFYYKRGDGDEETGLAWTEGYKVYPGSHWRKIAKKDILVVGGMKNTQDDYHFLFVETNAAAEKDPTASPVLFKSHTLTNPPSLLVNDHSIPSGQSCWEYRQTHNAVQPNFHIILSTGSGTGLAKAVYDQVLKPMLDHCDIAEGRDYVLHTTTSESSITELVRDAILPRANLGVKQSIMLMSGDGGVVDTINVLLCAERSKDYTKPSISVLPLGTGNALAHSAGITSDNTVGIKSWMCGEPRELPVFVARFSPGARFLFDEARQERPIHLADGVQTAYGAVVCSWGLHAGLVADSDTVEYRKFGVERFKMAAKEALFPSDGSPPHVYNGKVTIQRPGSEGWEEIRQGQHSYILATLVSQLEKGFTISPASKPLDGKLHLVHFGPVSGNEAMEVMGKAYQGGEHVNDERVRYEEIEGLRIEFHEEDPRWRRVCIDGKIVRVEKGGWVEVSMGQKGVVDLVAP